MLENQNLIAELIVKYGRNEELTAQEALILEDWRSQSPEHRVLPDLFREKQHLHKDLKALPPVPSAAMWEELQQRLTRGDARRRKAAIALRRGVRYAGAVAAVLFLVFGGKQLASYLTANRWRVSAAEFRSLPALPFRVVLTRGDSSQVVLDTVANGSLVVVSKNLHARKINDDSLTFEAGPGVDGGPFAWNRLVIGERRKPFGLRLPDGSRIRLLPGVRYEHSFLRDDPRPAILDGPAWFDIAKYPSKPFRLLLPNDIKVDVLGTCFAVSAGDKGAEPSLALLSGEVGIMGHGGRVTLQPFQMVALSENELKVMPLPEDEQFIAWSAEEKQNHRSEDLLFRFDHTGLSDAIREIAWWYQLKVYNPDHVKGLPITGIFRRNGPAEQVIKEIDYVESGAASLRIDSGIIVISPRGGR